MANFSKNYGSWKSCPACGNHTDGQEEIENCTEMKIRFKNLHILKNVYEEDVFPETAELVTDILRFRETP